jgi:hypothetical protein
MVVTTGGGAPLQGGPPPPYATLDALHFAWNDYHVRAIDLTGRRFGSLTVLGFSHNVAHYRHWLVRCDCGAETTVRGSSMTSENATKCKRCSELKLRGNISARSHGHSARPSSVYETWKAMKARCSNPTNASWKWYGAKGIKVCARWQDFPAFLADMGERPHGTTLHRINTRKDYEPSNCQWKKPPH